jgi:DNA-nicking Smr family endonuclease
MRRRTIDPAERALWQEAMRGVVPPRKKNIRFRDKTAHLKSDVETSTSLPETKADAAPSGVASEFNDKQRKQEAGLHSPEPGLDRRQSLRLRRGQLAIEGRLDLHGLTQAEAHRALASFVARSQAAGKRVLLIVTGKGSREGSGVLRGAVPRWLAEPALKSRVLTTARAVPRDGGDGAFYLLLRRAR